MESVPDISELLTTAPMALILLAYIYMSDKQKNKLIDSVSRINEKLIELIKDLSK